jgi:hypothetical protein
LPAARDRNTHKTESSKYCPAGSCDQMIPSPVCCFQYTLLVLSVLQSVCVVPLSSSPTQVVILCPFAACSRSSRVPEYAFVPVLVPIRSAIPALALRAVLSSSVFFSGSRLSLSATVTCSQCVPYCRLVP